ncbi:MAG: MurR/RpiR family transcriptional regulator [Terrisporobacter sp.]|uniref:MurR/RpiR family transcriptional regulator n=1 Tax=Terrisporobacter sp. TaxID=1965305 RepID=UPI002FCBECE8
MREDSCILRIKKQYFELRPSEVKVADFVLRNIRETSKISIGRLSQITGVSQPSIVRFVKAIGYTSYREFKDDIIENIASNQAESNISLLQELNLKEKDKIEDVPRKTIKTTIKILEETLTSIDTKDFEKAITMIVNARKINIYGVENSVGVISDLTNKLLYLGLDVRRFEDTYMQNLSANNMREEDLAIAISYSGTSKDTVDILKKAKGTGAKTLVITNFEESIISNYADVVLHSSNSKGHIYGNAIFSRTSQIVIVDMIYRGIILSDYDKFSHILDRNGEISSYKSY